MREHDKFMLRLPDGVRGYLKARAEAQGRSLNAEIVRRVELSIADDQAREADYGEPPHEDEPLTPAEQDAWDTLANPPTLRTLSQRLAELEAGSKDLAVIKGKLEQMTGLLEQLLKSRD